MLGLGLNIPQIAVRRNGLGSAPFKPSDITNNVLWLDATDSASVINSGGSVSAWNDKSGAGNNVTQATGGKRPVTGSRTVNSNNVIKFDGVDDFMSFPAALLGYPNSDYTYFFVAANDDGVGFTGDEQVIGSNNGSGDDPFAASYNSGSARCTFRSHPSTRLNIPITKTTNAGIYAVLKTGTSTNANAYGQNMLNAFGAGALSLTSIDMGATLTGTVNFWNGVVGELIFYSRLLTNTEANQVGNYLATKWGATWVAL